MTRALSTLPAPAELAGFQPGFGMSAKARALYAAGASTIEIAVYLGMSHPDVRRAVRQLPVVNRPKFRAPVDEEAFFATWWRRQHRSRKVRPFSVSDSSRIRR